MIHHSHNRNWNRRYDTNDNNDRARNEAAIFFDDETVGIDDGVIFNVSGVVRGTHDERLDEINAEEADEVDEGGDERDDGGAFTQIDDKRRRRKEISPPPSDTSLETLAS
ncbi:hypothetical protein U1Q18_013843 [Sarracenia purpurea var. burkii]